MFRLLGAFEWHLAVTVPPNMKRNNVKNERILATLPVIMFYEFSPPK